MKLIQNREELYDGLETDELYDVTFTVHDHAFTLHDIFTNEILVLKTQITPPQFSEIVTTSGFLTDETSMFGKQFREQFKDYKFSAEEFYRSVDGLTIYYVFRDNLLYLFSFGEIQPARYILYSEGVWEAEQEKERIDSISMITGSASKIVDPISVDDTKEIKAAFTQVATYNRGRFKKDLGKLSMVTATCVIIAIACHLLHADIISSWFSFFFIAMFLCLLFFIFKQDISKPAFSITKDGVCINQQFLRNAFVPWSDIVKVELRSYLNSQAIVITFRNIDTLLKGQFFVLKSVARANLLPNKTMVISSPDTMGDLNSMYQVMHDIVMPPLPARAAPGQQFNPGNDKITPLKPPMMYIRLENHMDKTYFREIVAAALKQAEEDYTLYPELPFHESFYNQLKDIQATVIERNVVYTEDEAYKRYLMSIITVKNFEGDERVYMKQIKDIVWGISRYPEMPEKIDQKGDLGDHLSKIQAAFAAFFKEHHFKLRSADRLAAVYENDYSELTFDFDSYGSRFGYISPGVAIYGKRRNDFSCSVQSMIEKMHQLDFDKLFKEYWDVKRLSYYKCWEEIIRIYLSDVIRDKDFSWVENFKKD